MINLTQDTVGGMFDKYADMVYRIALNIVKSREEAQDIVMETFLALIRQEYFESGVLWLPDKLNSTVYLFYYEDMTAAKIAGALGISENTVYKRLERGRSALKISLEEDAI